MATVFAKYPTSALITGGQTWCIMNIKEQGVAQVLGMQAGGSERPAGESGGRRVRRFCGQTTCPRYMCPDFYRKVFQMFSKTRALDSDRPRFKFLSFHLLCVWPGTSG